MISSFRCCFRFCAAYDELEGAGEAFVSSCIADVIQICMPRSWSGVKELLGMYYQAYIQPFSLPFCWTSPAPPTVPVAAATRAG